MAQVKAIVDKLLTQASSAYIPTGYVSESALPTIEVVQTTGKLAKYGNSHLRIENSLVAGRGGYRRVEPISRSTDTYTIEGHGLEGVVTADDRRNVEEPYKAEEDEVLGLTSQIWLGKEKGLADTLGSTSILTQNTTLSGTSQYSDFANSDPIDDFITARKAVRDGCGAQADTVVMDWQVANVLRFHPQMLDSLGYKDNRPGGLNMEELANAMGVRRLLLAEAVYNSAKEGQSDSLAPVWGKDIVFGVMPENAQVRQVSLGYLVKYAGKAPRQVYKYPIYNPPESTGIIVEDPYDMFISNANAGYLIKSAIA